MKFLSFNAITAASAAATQTSAAIPFESYNNASAIATVAGATSPVGTIGFQGSNAVPLATNVAFVPPEASWVTLPNAGTVNGNGSFACSSTVAVRWMRVVYTYTSGTGGTITVAFFANQDGG